MDNLIKDIQKTPRDKKLIVFDLDGTLADSKMDMDSEMAELFINLLEKKFVAVIGGGKYELFQRQLLPKLSTAGELLKKLYLFPTTSTAFYRYDEGGWKQVYAHNLSEEEKKRIFDAFEKAFSELGYKHPEKVYGEIIEDRGTQVTFSALGQGAPLELKDKWKKDYSDMKLKIAETVQGYLPDMEVRSAGFTSIDVTHKGIDKEYGLRQIEKQLNISLGEMMFVGDALFPGGNDSAALRTGIPCFEVGGIKDTKELIKYLL